MAARFGLGLRAQIVLALSVAFVLSFTLLGVTVVQLAERARRIDRRGGAEDVARVLATALPDVDGDRRRAFARLADRALEGGLVSGVAVEWGDLEPHVRGVAGPGVPIEVPLADAGGVVRVWSRPPGRASAAPLANLVLLYVATTGGAILLLAYVALTYLIVRPVEAVTRASEALAGGQRGASVPVRGAAELARLAVAFNAMASQLRVEREALEDRVRALERTTAELESTRDQLVRSERLASVGRLSAGVAHEIGNPLAAILGLVELLQAGDLDAAEAREFLDRVHRETERIQKTIRDLLDFSRQERDPADEGDDGDAEADLAAVVDDAVRLVEPQRAMRGVTVERVRAPDLRVTLVRGARETLTQVVVNLLLNAADAVDGRGRVRLTLSPEPGGGVRLDVEDDGPGIAAEIADHLFEPFVTTKPTGKGTGLGLAVSHTLVRRAGGSLAAGASDALGGARFTLRLRTR